MTNSIVTLQYNYFPVMFQSDAWLNATTIAKSFNKLPNEWLRLDSTKEYIKCLQDMLFNEKALRDNPATEQNQLVITKTGGNPNEQGTWIHPKLVINFARWLEIKFAVWCDMQIEKLLTPKPNALRSLPASPYVTPKEKLLLRKLVDSRCKKTNESHLVVWHKIFEAYAVNKMEFLPTGKVNEIAVFIGERVPELDEFVLVKAKDLDTQKTLPKPELGFKDLYHTSSSGIHVSILGFMEVLNEIESLDYVAVKKRDYKELKDKAAQFDKVKSVLKA